MNSFKALHGYTQVSRNSERKKTEEVLRDAARAKEESIVKGVVAYKDHASSEQLEAKWNRPKHTRGLLRFV